VGGKGWRGEHVDVEVFRGFGEVLKADGEVVGELS